MPISRRPIAQHHQSAITFDCISSGEAAAQAHHCPDTERHDLFYDLGSVPITSNEAASNRCSGWSPSLACDGSISPAVPLRAQSHDELRHDLGIRHPASPSPILGKRSCHRIGVPTVIGIPQSSKCWASVTRMSCAVAPTDKNSQRACDH